jgi:hypothetical protein
MKMLILIPIQANKTEICRHNQDQQNQYVIKPEAQAGREALVGVGG